MTRHVPILVALLGAAIFAGCGGTHTVTGKTPPPVLRVTYIPPESSRVPDGAQPASPPRAFSLSPNTMHISTQGLHLLESFEGFSSCPYYDSVGTGHPWTRGYGETEGIHSYSPCISRAQGGVKLKSLVESRYEWALRGLGVSLNEHQWDALCSFVYNLGAGIFTGTLRYDLQHRQFYAASRIMLQYDHAGEVVLGGLRTRREAEMRLFLTPVPQPPVHHRNRVAEHHHLKALYVERTKIRRHLLHAGCRVKHPRSACRPLFKHGAVVNHEIRVLHARHIF
jgi:lysozyme